MINLEILFEKSGEEFYEIMKQKAEKQNKEVKFKPKLFYKLLTLDPTALHGEGLNFGYQKIKNVGKYTNWILNKYKEGDEAIESLYDKLITYSNPSYKKYFVGFEDINKFKTYKDFVDYISEKEKEHKLIGEVENDSKKGIHKIVLDNDEWLVVALWDNKATHYWGENTVWCVSSLPSRYWDSYKNEYDEYIENYDLKDGKPPLYYYIANKEEIQRTYEENFLENHRTRENNNFRYLLFPYREGESEFNNGYNEAVKTTNTTIRIPELVDYQLSFYENGEQIKEYLKNEEKKFNNDDFYEKFHEFCKNYSSNVSDLKKRVYEEVLFFSNDNIVIEFLKNGYKIPLALCVNSDYVDSDGYYDYYVMIDRGFYGLGDGCDLNNYFECLGYYNDKIKDMPFKGYFIDAYKLIEEADEELWKNVSFEEAFRNLYPEMPYKNNAPFEALAVMILTLQKNDTVETDAMGDDIYQAIRDAQESYLVKEFNKYLENHPLDFYIKYFPENNTSIDFNNSYILYDIEDSIENMRDYLENYDRDLFNTFQKLKKIDDILGEKGYNYKAYYKALFVLYGICTTKIYEEYSFANLPKDMNSEDSDSLYNKLLDEIYYYPITKSDIKNIAELYLEVLERYEDVNMGDGELDDPKKWFNDRYGIDTDDDTLKHWFSKVYELESAEFVKTLADTCEYYKNNKEKIFNTMKKIIQEGENKPND